MSKRAQAVLDRVDAIGDIVRDGAAESEKLGRLAPAVIDALHAQDLFRIMVPVDLGGAGLTIPESIEVFERIASHDASTAWVFAILADGVLFARFLGPRAFEAVCQEPTVAGTLNPMTARARPVDGGYVFSGRATYLSGSLHAKWVLSSALVMDGDAPEVIDGVPHIRTGLFPIEHARCLDTWHVTGMRATGSSDYEFENVEVADDFTFAPFRPRENAGDDTFARIPLWAQLGGALSACAVGAAQNMLGRFAEIADDEGPRRWQLLDSGPTSACADRVRRSAWTPPSSPRGAARNDPGDVGAG